MEQRLYKLYRFFIGYWILHEAGFLSGLFYFFPKDCNPHGCSPVQAIVQGNGATTGKYFNFNIPEERKLLAGNCYNLKGLCINKGIPALRLKCLGYSTAVFMKGL